MKRSFLTASTLFLICLYSNLSAQITVSETPDLTDIKKLNAEIGFLSEKNEDFTVKFQPAISLKYGLSNKVELLLSSGFTTRVLENNESNVSMPLSLGGKYNFFGSEDYFIPNISIVGQITTDLNSNVSNQFISLYRILLTQKISDKILIDYNLGTEIEHSSGTITSKFSIATFYQILPKLNTFAEVYGTFQNNVKPDNHWDTGLSYHINQNFNIDDSFGRHFLKEKKNYILYLGTSFILPLNK